ncbi:MAG TPA: hypothetical protein V6D46_01070 [Coleofasciculaceae cyanobacterium]
MIALTALLGISSSLVGCSSAPTESSAASPSISPVASSSPSPIAASPNATPTGDHSQPKQGGQVVEDGDYHLEFVAGKEGKTTHLDLFLQSGDTHAAIAGAMVEAQVQKPDGTTAKVILPYDAPGQHYAASIPTTEPGEYLVKITAKIKGKTASGRFTFSN